MTQKRKIQQENTPPLVGVFNEENRRLIFYSEGKDAGSIILGDSIDFSSLSDEDLEYILIMALTHRFLGYEKQIDKDENGQYFFTEIKSIEENNKKEKPYRTSVRVQNGPKKLLLEGFFLVVFAAIITTISVGIIDLKPLALGGSFLTVVATFLEVSSQLKDYGGVRIL